LKRGHSLAWNTNTFFLDNYVHILLCIDAVSLADDVRGTRCRTSINRSFFTQVNDRFSLAIASTLRKDGTADEGAFDQSK
jgi:hypothetical protein